MASKEWLVDLHASLLAGSTGRFVNGIGALCLMSLCLTGALGFRTFLFVPMWAVSGLYSVFPDSFGSPFAIFDPADRFYDSALSWLSEAYFGRFGRFTEALWSALGLALVLLSISGVFV